MFTSQKRHPYIRGEHIQPDKYNGFNDISYACVDYRTDGQSGKVYAWLIDPDGVYVRETVVADCRVHASAVQYAKHANDDVAAKAPTVDETA